jgi:hypothetical protein
MGFRNLFQKVELVLKNLDSNSCNADSIILTYSTCPYRLVVRTPECGSGNPGSIPGKGFLAYVPNQSIHPFSEMICSQQPGINY